MRIERVRIKNLGPFRDVDLDLSTVAGPLVAVTGDNGEGKTALLEFMFGGALYRQCPTQGTLVKRATARDSMVEVCAVNGRAYTVRQTVDAISGKGESLILDAAGKSMLDTAKVTESDTWVAKHFPSPKVLYSSEFLAQASGGFAQCERADRTAVFLRLLRIERFEGFAKSARERASQAKATCDTMAARLSEARKRYPDLAESEAADAYTFLLLQEAEKDLAAAVTEHEDAKHWAVVARARLPLDKRLKQCSAQLRDLTERIANNRMLLGREQEITLSAALVTDTMAQLAKLDVLTATAQAARVRAQQDVTLGTQNGSAVERRVASATQRRDAANARLRDKKAVDAAVAALPVARKELAACKTKHATRAAELEETEKSLLTSKDERISGLRGGLQKIAGGDRATVARTTLTADDKLKAAATGGPARLKKLREALECVAEQLDTLTEKVSTLRARAERSKDMAAAAADATEAQSALEALATETAAAARALTVALTALKAADAKRAAIVEQRRALGEALIEQQPIAKLAEPLKDAKLRLSELVPQSERLQADMAVTEAELAALPVGGVDDYDRLVALYAEVERAQQSERLARDNAARAAERLAAARAGVSVRAELENELTAAQRVFADWTRLGQDLGKDGIQALEIDAALPQLNELTNDLLHSCYGSRYTVEVRTDRLSSDGKRQLEDLDVRVLDTVGGCDKSIEEYSGGQKVILGEALSLALAMLACQRAGLSRPTLVRDESGAALDPENGRAYIAMLRRAAVMLDCDKVLFVTHNPELQELADARLVVAGGTVVVA